MNQPSARRDGNCQHDNSIAPRQCPDWNRKLTAPTERATRSWMGALSLKKIEQKNYFNLRVVICKLCIQRVQVQDQCHKAAANNVVHLLSGEQVIKLKTSFGEI